MPRTVAAVTRCEQCGPLMWEDEHPNVLTRDLLRTAASVHRAGHPEHEVMVYTLTPDWVPEPDEEHGQQYTYVRGVRVTIYSDRGGQTWHCAVEGQKEDWSLEATTVHEARVEARREAVRA